MSLVSQRNWIMAGDVPRVMVPRAIFPEMAAGVPAARVYAALALRAHNVTGLVDSTIRQIAEDARMGTSQVSDGVARLVADGWLTRVRVGNSRQSSKYQMHAVPQVGLPGFPGGSDTNGASGNPGGSDETAGQGPPGNPGSPEEVESPGLPGNPGGPPITAGQELPGFPEPPNGASGNPDWTPRKSGSPLVYPKNLTKDLTNKASASLPPDDETTTPTPPVEAIPEPKPAPKPKRPEPPRDDVNQLCGRLRDAVTNGGFRKPNVTEDWRRQARLLLDADKRELGQALRLIDWATSHSFWAPNVLSMPKFREKYDQLLGQARHEHQQAQRPNGPRTVDDKIADLQRLKTGTNSKPALYALPGGDHP